MDGVDVIGKAKAAPFLLVFLLAFRVGAQAQFETRATLPISTGVPIAAAAGDFDRDGKLDLAVVEFVPKGMVTILLGNGDGTFRVGASYEVAMQPESIVTGDFRQNGILDLVVTDTLSDNIFVLLGYGDGTFQPSVELPAGGVSSAAGTGDFTGDGKLDIIAITASTGCTCVSVFPGNGDGTFQPALTTPVPYNTDALAIGVGHFDTGRSLDIAVPGEFGSVYQVDILLGTGDGIFRDDGYYAVESTPQSIAVGDFNGDKKLDLAVGNYGYGSVGILLGNGDGTFQQAVNYGVPSPSSLLAEALDGDGALDLAVANFSRPAGVSVLKGNGDGTFQTASFYPVAGGEGTEISYVVSGDFNGDHRPDLIAVDYGFDNVVTMLNTGTAAFSPTTPLAFKKQSVGTRSAAQKVTLTNTGKTSLAISAMKVAGQFGMSSTCGKGVVAGKSCSISVTFAPTSQGAKSGTVTINDSASSKPMVIELSGTAT